MNAARASGVALQRGGERLRGDAVRHPQLVLVLGRDERRLAAREHQPVDHRRVRVALHDDAPRRAAPARGRGRGCPAWRRWSGRTCARRRAPRRPAAPPAGRASAPARGRCPRCPAGCRLPARTSRARRAGPGRRRRRPCGRARGSGSSRAWRTRRPPRGRGRWAARASGCRPAPSARGGPRRRWPLSGPPWRWPRARRGRSRRGRRRARARRCRPRSPCGGP